MTSTDLEKIKDKSGRRPSGRKKTSVVRVAPERPVRNALDGIPAEGKIGRGRPKKTWRHHLAR